MRAMSCDAMAPRIAIFSPSLLFTVTIEQQPDGCPEIHFHPGGQGYWVARMVATLGARPVLCAPVGGESGRVLESLLAGSVELRAVPTMRPNGSYVHDRRDGRRQVLAEVLAPALTRHEADDLYDLFVGEALRADAAVLTGARPGVLHEGTWARLARDLAGLGRPVVVDVSGGALRTLRGGVTVLKVSACELVWSGYCDDEREHSLARAARALLAQGAERVVVSRGDEPALVFSPDFVRQVRGPRLAVVEPSGAGDSLTAALAVVLARGGRLDEGLRLGSAAGALSVTRHGLGGGVRSSIETLADHVELRGRDDLV